MCYNEIEIGSDFLSKKEIIILVIVFLIVVAISTVTIYSIINKKPSGNGVDDKVSNTLKVGNYSLKYGTYKGMETEYNHDTKKTEKKEIKLVLSKDKINDTKYEVKGTSLYVNGYEMYKVIANNKMELLAGEGVELVYEEK